MSSWSIHDANPYASSSTTTRFLEDNTNWSEKRMCHVGGEGIFLPISQWVDGWNENSSWGEQPYQSIRGLIYIVLLGWFFMGVAISSDVFMSGIEKITSQRQRVPHPVQEGRWMTVTVWNDTVANLTLMAFGSSTPEILLSLIELLSRNLFMGELGAATIVGSAAFNLLIIIGICIVSIDVSEVRMIKELNVYYITAGFSLLAYLWLYFVLCVRTENEVEIWEAVLTLIFFPLLVCISYAADRGYFAGGRKSDVTNVNVVTYEGMTAEELEEMCNELRKNYNKDLPDEKIMKLLESQLKPKKTRSSYRSGAIRNITGGKKSRTTGKYGASSSPKKTPATPTNKISAEEISDTEAVAVVTTNSEGVVKADAAQVFWDVMGNNFVCLECCGHIEVPVKVLPNNRLTRIHYNTRDGTAKAPSEYKEISGVLEFPPSTVEETKHVKVEIIDDDEVEDEMEFTIELKAEDPTTAEIYGSVCTVTIIDDDEPGVIQFKDEQITIPENETSLEIPLIRRKGACGIVTVAIKTEEGTAKPEIDYEPVEDETITFEAQAIDQSITLNFPTVSQARIREGLEFRLILSSPTGGAKINAETDGGENECICTIVFSASVAKSQFYQKARSSILNRWEVAKLGSGTYRAQFTQAIYCNGSKEEQSEASKSDWVMHILTIPWKLLCACVPPPIYKNGWFTFIGALLVILIQTAFVADVAEMVGCCYNIPNVVTAITLVALGTSLPDTFASRTAAMQDEYADSSVTNVTGSNSVNVFLGLGIPWTIGSIYWHFKGKTVEWQGRIAAQNGSNGVAMASRADAVLVHWGGTLGISVVIYCCCAIVALSLLAWRRAKVKGEFGGPRGIRNSTAGCFILLWVIYVMISSYFALEAEQ